MAFGKSKAPKEPKPPKAPKEKKPKKPKKERPPKGKKPKKGQELPVEETGAVEGEEQPKKKKPLIFFLIPIVVIAAAAAIIILVVIPKFTGDKDAEPSASVEPDPPVLPSELPVGDNKVPGMVLGSDEYQAQAVLAKTITYTYTDLADAGKVAETYVGQLQSAEDRFSIVDEEFVRQKDEPDFTTEEGMVLMARNLPKPEPAASPSPEPTPTPEGEENSAAPDESAAPSGAPSAEPTESAEPAEEAPDLVLTVRITWSPGQCVVTADEEEGRVTSPPSAAPAQHPVTQRSAMQILEGMSPAELGLPGDSMDAYEVIPMDGTELVNDMAAIRLHVYGSSTSGANDFLGSYLMTIDGDHLYRVDPITDEVVEVEGYEYTAP